jgi:multiple sugar transport system substrate-binding protein
MKSQSVLQPSAPATSRASGIFQYYSIAEDELQKTFAKQTAQQARQCGSGLGQLTDKLGRENQVKYYRISMGLT